MCRADDFRLSQNKLLEITFYLQEMPVDRSIEMLFFQCAGTPCAHTILKRSEVQSITEDLNLITHRHVLDNLQTLIFP